MLFSYHPSPQDPPKAPLDWQLPNAGPSQTLKLRPGHPVGLPADLTTKNGPHLAPRQAHHNASSRAWLISLRPCTAGIKCEISQPQGSFSTGPAHSHQAKEPNVTLSSSGAQNLREPPLHHPRVQTGTLGAREQAESEATDSYVPLQSSPAP